MIFAAGAMMERQDKERPLRERVRALSGAREKFGWSGLNTFRVGIIRQNAGKRVLDIGGSHGDYVNYLCARGYDGFGLDLLVSDNWHQLDAWGRFILADAQDLPIESGTFDTVICFNVLEHVPDFSRALAEAARVLRRHGKLILVVPNCADDEVLRLANLNYYHWTDLTHLHAFTADSITDALISTGFAVEELIEDGPIRPELLLLDMWHVPLGIARQISRVVQHLPFQKKRLSSLLVVASKA